MFSPSYLSNTPSSLIILPEQSSDFTITIGGVVPVKTTDNPVVATVTPNPQPGDRFAVADSRWNAENNNITVDFLTNNHLVYGLSNNYGININGGYVEFIFIDSEIGWLAQK